MKVYGLISILFFFVIISGCTKTTEEQVQKYMKFYYPTSGEFTYNVVFEWGEYEIFTFAKMDEEVHADSEPFKGFITFRPSVSNETIPVYIITPDGEVWKTTKAESIPANTTRQEITEEKTEFGTTTQTRTINSSSEPLILSFKNNKEIWERYGTLTADGDQSSFEAVQ